MEIRRTRELLEGSQLEAVTHLEGMKAVGVPEAIFQKPFLDELHGKTPGKDRGGWV